MLFSKLQALVLGLTLASEATARAVNLDTQSLYNRQQDLVTWDDHSLFVRGERVMVFSGEFHPFRLPVPGLWLDVLQKIKASGYNCISIYIDWFLLEGEPGKFRAEGVFDLQPFFDAAKQAGLYVLARPGPYINAEVSGGGFPGWLSRVPGALRTNTDEFIGATDNYIKEISKIIAKNQITNDGPVILLQIENEYQNAIDGYDMPSYDYWNSVEGQFRDTDIAVPIINNEAHQYGYITAHTPASVDIYGHDGYPLGFDCENPQSWPEDGLPTDWLAINNEIAPDTPYTIPEFQGGGFQHWGQAGFANCALLLNMEFERVLYKNNYAVGATIFNIYMIYGGTNWGNLGGHQGFTSYDYGAQITEERQLWREKYSEVKLQANFFHVSPAFLEADRFNSSLQFTHNDAITVTPATTNSTKFYIARHTDYANTESVPYRLTVKTVDYGEIEIPQLGDSLVMNRRDSKIHVSDYPAGDKHIIYSSAEVFTWKKYDDKTILVVYGGPNEHHELAVANDDNDFRILEGDEGENVSVQSAKDDYTIISWDISDDPEDRKVVRVHSDFYIYMLNRNEAYNFWVPPTGAGSDYGTSDVIVKAGYLMRTAQVDGATLNLVGDVNATTPIEIIGGAPAKLEALNFNGRSLPFTQSNLGVVKATVDFEAPDIKLPCLSNLQWKKIDSLPEISGDYDDSAWVDADLEESPNDRYPIKTHVSLRAGDYGFHTGSVLFRGHFTANGKESTFEVVPQGGSASGSSLWLDDTFLGSYLGEAEVINGTITADLPALEDGSEHVFTLVMDHMGLHDNYVVGEDMLKDPRGIQAYDFPGHDGSDITWKMTGNLGGEQYVDKVRGPLNEGGLFVERQGFHQPSAPTSAWDEGKPTDGMSDPGITYYTATFDLDIPEGYDVPLAFKFDDDVSDGVYRAQLYVNGYQYGKFVPLIGPQYRFPVHEGILNHHGENTIGITIWAQERGGAKPKGLGWDVSMITETGFGTVELSPAPGWEKRKGAY
ncbi:beta-galactosidase [Emericellopsis atlantica]|uniref:beta-galactosidase n=1 Tax=Emericellopsis atlantica TaxID=2614577 RepID=A0A9P7ZNK4_9HYPO|nr:beta-galactosidase [Emericellopsis atlantica]KAG9254840.1 beta-galactosidase [Emericellopsis atlantica]